MKENFEFVTIENYNKDMSDIAALGAANISRVIKERDEYRACIAAMVKAMGKIEIPQDFNRVEQGTYEMAKDMCNNTLIFRAINN